MKEPHEEARVGPHAKVGRVDAVLPVGGPRRQLRARGLDDVRHGDRLRPWVAVGERHEIVDDSVRGPSAPLELRDMKKSGLEVAPGSLLTHDVCGRRDDLQYIAKLVGDFERNFAEARQPVLRLAPGLAAPVVAELRSHAVRVGWGDGREQAVAATGGKWEARCFGPVALWAATERA